jgi:hypothetical protein
MYVIIGSHFVQLEGKFLFIALVIVRITLNVIVRQMPITVCHRSKSCYQALKHFDNVISTCCENVVEVFDTPLFSRHVWAQNGFQL